MIQRVAIALAVALSATSLHAQDTTPEPEVLAQAKPGEKMKFDLQSVKKYGDVQGQFDVIINWSEDADIPKPKDYTPRRVRYITNCQDGTMTVAAVGIFDQIGQITKTVVAPPRSLDPVKPEKGTPQSKWIQQVCMF